jgi:hypothetical protein
VRLAEKGFSLKRIDDKSVYICFNQFSVHLGISRFLSTGSVIRGVSLTSLLLFLGILT